MRLPIWDDTDWTYIKGLSRALESISQKYIYDTDKKKYHIERIFSYELYHKWSNFLRKKNANPEKLMLNAELSKHYDEVNDVKFPDLVLHGDFTNTKKQYIICEIKSSRNYVPDDALEKDIESLLNGMNKLGYHCGIFVYLGGEKSVIVKRLREIVRDRKLDYNPSKQIIVAKVVNYRNIRYVLL